MEEKKHSKVCLRFYELTRRVLDELDDTYHDAPRAS